MVVVVGECVVVLSWSWRWASAWRSWGRVLVGTAAATEAGRRTGC
jgi:hypothetical protein